MRLCLRDTFARVAQWKVRPCSYLGPADVQAARGLAVSADHEVHEPLMGPCLHCVGEGCQLLAGAAANERVAGIIHS